MGWTDEQRKIIAEAAVEVGLITNEPERSTLLAFAKNGRAFSEQEIEWFENVVLVHFGGCVSFLHDDHGAIVELDGELVTLRRGFMKSDPGSGRLRLCWKIIHG